MVVYGGKDLRICRLRTNDLNPGPSVPESSMLTTRLWRSCTCRHILQFRGVTLLCYDFCCTCNSNFCCGIYLNASVLAAFSQRKMHHVMSVDIQFTTPVQNLFNISACFPVKPAIHTDLLHLKTSVIDQRFSSINVIMNNVKKICCAKLRNSFIKQKTMGISTKSIICFTKKKMQGMPRMND